jgi:hypothetical protein
MPGGVLPLPMLASRSTRRKHHDLRFFRLRQEIGGALDQGAAVVREDMGKKHGFETEDATLDRRHLALDPVAQNAVDGNMPLTKGCLLIFDALGSLFVAPRVLLKPPPRPARRRGAQVYLATAMFEVQQNLLLHAAPTLGV